VTFTTINKVASQLQTCWPQPTWFEESTLGLAIPGPELGKRDTVIPDWAAKTRREVDDEAVAGMSSGFT
jgi:hypothetical protein